MFKDYSGSMIFANGGNRLISSRKKSMSGSHEIFSVTKLVWKTVGFMLLLTLVLGISSTVWYGLQVRVALDQIGNDNKINHELRNENKLLLSQRDFILTPEQMEKAARNLGLISPAKNQLRYK